MNSYNDFLLKNGGTNSRKVQYDTWNSNITGCATSVFFCKNKISCQALHCKCFMEMLG